MASQPDYSKLHPASFAARDYAGQQRVEDISDLFHDAEAESGISVNRMLKEVKQGRRWPGNMTRREYVSWKLYGLDKTERKTFISDWMHWPIHDICMDEEWSEKTVDKWVCADVLVKAGIPTIPTLAMIDGSGASYGSTPTISTSDELLEFLGSAAFPLFAKPNALMGSFGAFRIDGLDDDHVVIDGGEASHPVDRIMSELLSNLPYVLQSVVENHSDVRVYAEGLATLRTVNFVKNGSVRMDRAVFKIPASGNFADNNWRDGNLLASVDAATGTIERVTRGIGADQVEFDEHPETGTVLVGATLPSWDEVIDVNARTANVFGAISYQSQDIAFTDAGPIVVEVNSGGSFALPQMASRRGLLTPENKDFLESCGVNFRKLPDPPHL